MSLVIVLKRHPDVTPETLGLIPSFLDTDDPRSARDQFDAKYISGWDKFEGHTMRPDGSIKYPQDPPLPVIAEIRFRDEVIYFYEYTWVAILGNGNNGIKEGEFEICRMD